MVLPLRHLCVLCVSAVSSYISHSNPKNSKFNVRILLSKKEIGKHIPASQNSLRIEGPLQLRHLPQMLFTVKLKQIVAFQLANAVFGRDCATHIDGPTNECSINLPGPFGFDIIARKNVHVHVIVADMAKDCVFEITAPQRLLIKT